MHLHAYIIMVALTNHPHQIKRTSNDIKKYLTNFMFEDAERRFRLLDMSPTAAKESLKEYLAIHYGITTAYDHGIATTDAVLASAVWRNLFTRQMCAPSDVLKVVQYMRHNITRLEQIPYDDVIRANFQFSQKFISTAQN